MTRQGIRASTWHERVAHRRSSGLSADAYAREHDIGLARLKYWARRVLRGVVRPQMLAVRVSAAAVSSPLELRRPSATAKLNGLDPARWLRDTLEQLPTCRNSKSIRCCHLRTLPRLDSAWEVGWLHAYK